MAAVMYLVSPNEMEAYWSLIGFKMMWALIWAIVLVLIFVILYVGSFLVDWYKKIKKGEKK